MSFERLTDNARKVMALANQEAQRFNHEYISTEHILLGLVKEESGIGAQVLKKLEVDLRKVRLEVEKLVKSGPEMVRMGKLSQTPRAKKVIEYAHEEARNMGHNYVGTEHLLLGLLREHNSIAAQVLMNLGLKIEDVREEVLNLLTGEEEGDGESSSDGGNPFFDSDEESEKTPPKSRPLVFPGISVSEEMADDIHQSCRDERGVLDETVLFSRLLSRMAGLAKNGNILEIRIKSPPKAKKSQTKKAKKGKKKGKTKRKK